MLKVDLSFVDMNELAKTKESAIANARTNGELSVVRTCQFMKILV